MSSRIAYAPARNSSARWARVAVIAQAAFVLSWLVAMFWQGSRYDPFAHSIGDMYAVTAPDGLFLVVVLTLCGVATALFAVLAGVPGRSRLVWPTRVVGIAIIALTVALAGAEAADLGGLVERLLAAVGAAAIAALGVRLASTEVPQI